MVFCVEDADTFVVTDVNVPEPFAASTLIVGLVVTFVSVPPLVDFSCPCHVTALPVVAVAVAPSEAAQEPPEVAPYVMTVLAPPARVSPETVIVWPEVPTVPTVAEVQPIPFVVTGAVHPEGTAIVTEPFEMPPVAAV
jgi:hypothetical protein